MLVAGDDVLIHHQSSLQGVRICCASPFPCRYQFNYPSTVTLLQIMVSLVLMYVLRAAGAMQFGGLTVRSARKVNQGRHCPAVGCSQDVSDGNGATP